MKGTMERITFDDGASTTLERWGERGPMILCVHGMTSSRKSWVPFAQRFADRYRIAAYDQRGHGDAAEVAGPMSLARAVHDLHEVAAHTGADLLVGHSWGGAVVVRGGRDLGSRAVIAIDPMLVQADDTWYAEFIADLEETFTFHGDARDERVRSDYAAWPPLDVEGKVHAVHAMTTAPIAGLRDQNRGDAWDLRADVAAYAKPLLLVMAGRDESIVPPAVQDEIAAHHPPTVRIVRFDDQGHNLHRTAFDRFARAVDEFLDAR